MSQTLRTAIRILRETWKDKIGAESDAVRIVCDAAEQLMKDAGATRADMERMKSLVVDHLQWRMASVITDTPENLARRRIRELEDNVAVLKAQLGTRDHQVDAWQNQSIDAETVLSEVAGILFECNCDPSEVEHILTCHADQLTEYLRVVCAKTYAAHEATQRWARAKFAEQEPEADR